jgi:hypothetical protein
LAQVEKERESQKITVASFYAQRAVEAATVKAIEALDDADAE